MNGKITISQKVKKGKKSHRLEKHYTYVFGLEIQQLNYIRKHLFTSRKVPK